MKIKKNKKITKNETGKINIPDTSTESNENQKFLSETDLPDDHRFQLTPAIQSPEERAVEERADTGLPVGFTMEPQDRGAHGFAGS